MGNTFRKKKKTAFHIVRYDFKPASVDSNQEGQIDVGDNNDVTITLPHSQGSKSVYKGSKKPVQKECVLIFDPSTGTFTLERITSQIQVKKTRQAPSTKFQPSNSNPPSNPLKLAKKKTTKKSSIQKLVKQTAVVLDSKKSDDEEFMEFSMPTINHQLETKTQPRPEIPEPPNQKMDTGETLSSSDDDDDDSSSSGSSSSDDSSSSNESTRKLDDALNAASADFNSLHEDLQLSDSDSDSD
uniref:Transcription elongation factor Eaf N-terminal domain-containing protein n=1 Tax=Ciona savignyi TaxID=51511 RepID=H2YGY1_CIOSA